MPRTTQWPAQVLPPTYCLTRQRSAPPSVPRGIQFYRKGKDWDEDKSRHNPCAVPGGSAAVFRDRLSYEYRFLRAFSNSSSDAFGSSSVTVRFRGSARWDFFFGFFVGGRNLVVRFAELDGFMFAVPDN